MISPPQANIKLCTYGVLKAQNQVIGMILQITILKVLPKEGVPLVSFPLFNHFLRLSIRLGYNEVCTLRCLWTFATLESVNLQQTTNLTASRSCLAHMLRSSSRPLASLFSSFDVYRSYRRCRTRRTLSKCFPDLRNSIRSIRLAFQSAKEAHLHYVTVLCKWWS